MGDPRRPPERSRRATVTVTMLVCTCDVPAAGYCPMTVPGGWVEVSSRRGRRTRALQRRRRVGDVQPDHRGHEHLLQCVRRRAHGGRLRAGQVVHDGDVVGQCELVGQARRLLCGVDGDGDIAHRRCRERLGRQRRCRPLHQQAPDLGRPGAAEHGDPRPRRLHRYLSLVEADPHGRRQLGDGADEPRVVVVVVRAGLADLRTPDVGGGSRPVQHHVLQDVVGRSGNLRLDDLLGCGSACHRIVPSGRDHRFDRHGIDAPASGRERAVGARHLQRVRLVGAEHGAVDRQQRSRRLAHRGAASHPHLLGGPNDRVGAELLDQLRVDGVHRLLGRGPQAERAVARAVRVRHLPRAAARERQRDRGGRGEGRVGGVAVLERGDQRERFERRSRLAAGSPRAGGEVHAAGALFAQYSLSLPPTIARTYPVRGSTTVSAASGSPG